MLLTPPFDKTSHDPGYIKGYLPGVRENGAQYSHAALWSVLATARLGRRDRAFELFQMINPLTHARTPEEVATYKVEPYVVAADVYTAAGHLGRGGWTWYTGSASWMYRVGLEEILGFTRRGNKLHIRPCVPTGWPSYTIDYRFGTSRYHITVYPSQADGSFSIPLVDDGQTHEIEVGHAERGPSELSNGEASNLCTSGLIDLQRQRTLGRCGSLTATHARQPDPCWSPIRGRS